ncbi:hypothetical protein BGZ47_007060 [Haplosporangium gracile]|nr:hypothetical protein BGZ47_007060 [Haplosporangium gracile]
MSTHPLDLPEIVERIGHFLPLWTYELSKSNNRLVTVFNPTTFHACMLVSKLWHQTLLPVLWADYDAEGMVRIPEEVLDRNSHYFRTFLLQKLAACKISGCTRLVKATFHPNVGSLERVRQMIQSNPGLKSLEYDGGACEFPLEPNGFAQLPQLEEISLSDCDIIVPGNLGRALAPLAESLRKLTLGGFAGFWGDRDCYGAQPTEESCNDGEFGDTPLLPLVEYLRVTGPPFGPDPTGLVRRCSNLVRLDLTLNRDISRSKSHFLTQRLSDSISEHCPKLSSLALRGSLDQDHKEALIRACAATNSLSELVVVVPSVGQDTINSIALHALTLETLGILNTTNDDVDLDHLFQLPGRCPRLKWFSVAAWSCSDTPGRTVLDALKRSSIERCHDLEILDVDIQEPSRNEMGGDDEALLAKLFKNGPLDGWYYHSEELDIPGDGVDFEMSTDLVYDLFKAVEEFGFGHFRQLRWSGAMFTRSSSRASAKYDGIPFIYFD